MHTDTYLEEYYQQSLMEQEQSEQHLREEAERLREEIRENEKKLQDIQERCRHSQEELKFVAEKNGKVLRVLCKDCKKTLRYPSANDLEENGYKEHTQ